MQPKIGVCPAALFDALGFDARHFAERRDDGAGSGAAVGGDELQRDVHPGVPVARGLVAGDGGAPDRIERRERAPDRLVAPQTEQTSFTCAVVLSAAQKATSSSCLAVPILRSTSRNSSSPASVSAVATPATAQRPPPAAAPIAAVVQIAAAVVRPTTNRLCSTIIPAPRKPTPVTICAATRATSTRTDCHASPGCTARMGARSNP